MFERIIMTGPAPFAGVDRGTPAARRRADPVLTQTQLIKDCSVSMTRYGGYDRGQLLHLPEGSARDVTWGQRYPVLLMHSSPQKAEKAWEKEVPWWFGYGYQHKDNRYSKGSIEAELCGLQEDLKHIYPGSPFEAPYGLGKYVEGEGNGDLELARAADFSSFHGICFVRKENLVSNYEGGIEVFHYPAQKWPPDADPADQFDMEAGDIEVFTGIFGKPMLVIRVETWEDIVEILLDYYVIKYSKDDSGKEYGILDEFPYTIDPAIKDQDSLLSINKYKVGKLGTLPASFQVLKTDGKMTAWEIFRDIALFNDTTFWIGSDPEIFGIRGSLKGKVTNHFFMPAKDTGSLPSWELVKEDLNHVSDIEETLGLDSLINCVTLVPDQDNTRGSGPNRNWAWESLAIDKASIRAWGRHELRIQFPLLTSGQLDMGREFAQKILDKYKSSGRFLKGRTDITFPSWSYRPLMPPIDRMKIEGYVEELEDVWKVNLDFNESPHIKVQIGAPSQYVSLLSTRLGTRFGMPKIQERDWSGGGEGYADEGGADGAQHQGDHHTEEVEGSVYLRVRQHLLGDDEEEDGEHLSFPYTDNDEVEIEHKEPWPKGDDVSTTIYGKVWEQIDTLRRFFEWINVAHSESEEKAPWEWQAFLMNTPRWGTFVSLNEGQPYVKLKLADIEGNEHDHRKDEGIVNEVDCYVVDPDWTPADGGTYPGILESLQEGHTYPYLPLDPKYPRKGLLLVFGGGPSEIVIVKIVSYSEGVYTVQPVIRDVDSWKNDGDPLTSIHNYGEVQTDEAGYLAGPSGEDIYVPLLTAGDESFILVHPPRMV